MTRTDLLHELNTSYIKRCDDKSLARPAWKDLTAEFPPVFKEDIPVPFILTKDAGDIGLAMMWIVQSTVVRGILSVITHNTNDMLHKQIASIREDTLGALAHSEPADAPVVCTDAGDGWILSGRKKYITGGCEAEFLLVTARMPGEEKISSLFFIPADKLPGGSISPVLSDSLKTAPHGSLNLESYLIGKGYRFDIPANEIRRHVLSAGLLERILIVEALTGMVLFLRRELTCNYNETDEKLMLMAENIHKGFISARSSFTAAERITPAIPDIALLAEAIVPLESVLASPPEGHNGERIRDLKFILSLIPGLKR